MELIGGIAGRPRLSALVAISCLAMPANALADPPLREAAFKETPKQWAWLAPIGPYWPDRALRMGVGGYAILDCVVDDKSSLSGCKIVTQQPVGLAFGEASVMMVTRRVMTAGPAPIGATAPPDDIWRFRVEFPAHALSFVKTPADPNAIIERRTKP